MSRTVDIPGGTATLYSPDEMPQRRRRAFETASIAAVPALRKVQRAVPQGTDPAAFNIAEADMTPEEFTAMYELQDATILAYLKEWTLEQPLPKCVEDLGEISAGVYDALRAATASDGAQAVADFSPNPDPESPTVDSGASETPSKAAPESASTETQPSTGASTASAS